MRINGNDTVEGCTKRQSRRKVMNSPGTRTDLFTRALRVLKFQNAIILIHVANSGLTSQGLTIRKTGIDYGVQNYAILAAGRDGQPSCASAILLGGNARLHN